MRWVVTFALICIATIGAVLAAGLLVDGFDLDGLSGHGMVALTLGAVGTSALATALMALVFYSDRTGRDDAAHGPGAPRRH